MIEEFRVIEATRLVVNYLPQKIIYQGNSRRPEENEVIVEENEFSDV